MLDPGPGTVHSASPHLVTTIPAGACTMPAGVRSFMTSTSHGVRLLSTPAYSGPLLVTVAVR
jgi:hypothetical protein